MNNGMLGMRRRSARALQITVAVLGALQLSVMGATAAQAAPLTFVSVPHQVYNGNTSCASRSICVWNEANFHGAFEATFATSSNHSQWTYFPNDLDVGFQPNSLVDNSGSAIYLYDKRDNEWSCVNGGVESDSLLNASFGYFWVDYGENLCSVSPPQPLP